MDNFEKHIRKNKQAFDVHKVDKDRLWQAITTQLDNDKGRVVPLWKSRKLRVAASIILLMGLSLTAFLMMGNPASNVDGGYANEELLDIDMYYKNLVHQQVQLVKNHPALAVKDKDEFLSFMEELDHEYEQLRLELANNLDNERVLEAIVNNYKKRIELIENLLKQINASKKEMDYEGYIL